MSNPKVFEFAKEVGMTPLALMDKIREWHIPVKSHMSELEPEVLDLIKVKMRGSQGSSEDKPKKATTRKAPAKTTKTAATKTATKAPAKTAAKSTAKSVTAKGATKATATAAASAATATALAAASKSVIRRKAKEAEEIVPKTAEALPEEEETNLVSQPQVITKKSAQVEVEPVAIEESPVKSAASAPPIATQPVAGPPVSARKKEVVVGTSGVSSNATPVTTVGRKNIIGRMDLSRVGPQQGRPGGPQSQQGGGTQRPGFSGPPRTGAQRNIRPGFVSAPTEVPDLQHLHEDAFEKKRMLDKKKKIIEGASTNVAKEREQEDLQQFNAVEFRKREMVFQPKKKKGLLNRESKKTEITTPKASKRVLKINGTMKVSDLAQEMGIKAAQLTKALMNNGVQATMNSVLDFDTIALIVPELGWEAQNVFKTAEGVVTDTAFGDLKAVAVTRPPVVTIMGHVDHGKTSLLDTIRKTDVASREAGGITQHIGAYNVTLEDGSKITFLDTPGHEAFTAMRARGANATDIAIIVVAADDGVMPQTAEAINHAKAANVPIIIAVNKIDKPGANIEKIKQQMTEFELVPEEWGGTTIFCPVSAVKKQGIKELLEQIKLVAEMQELKANPLRSGTGIVIEAKLEKGRGAVATVLIKDGTVRIGQFVVAGSIKGRVKSLTNDRRERIQEAGPGQPVEILGLDAAPMAGDRFDVVKDEATSDEVSQLRVQLEKDKNGPTLKPTLEEMFAKANKGDLKELPIILKADVQGSAEAIQGMLAKVSTPEVKTKVIHTAVGGINESDVLLAQTAKAFVIGFNVRPDSGAAAKAKQLGIEIRTYSIVYELIDDIKKAMTGLLTPDIVEKVMGRAEVRNTFNLPKAGTIAGCLVSEGKIQRSNMLRLIRNGKIVYEGKVSSLKRFKDDAKEVAQGFECGIGIENFNDIKVGDIIEAFVKEEQARELTSEAQV
ncbi:MAG: translation initiation factor IF-2 [Bdellovibrionota bacterium]